MSTEACCDLVYYCPQVDGIDCALHGAEHPCCLRPDLHRPIDSVDMEGRGTEDGRPDAEADGRGVRGDGASDLAEPVGVPPLQHGPSGADPGTGLRGQVQGSGLAGKDALDQLLGAVGSGVGPWACYHIGCRQRYLSVGLLADHLIDYHHGPETETHDGA